MLYIYQIIESPPDSFFRGRVKLDIAAHPGLVFVPRGHLEEGFNHGGVMSKSPF